MFANRVKWDFLQLIDFFLVLSLLRLPVPAFLTIPRGSDFKQGNEDKELKEGRLIKVGLWVLYFFFVDPKDPYQYSDFVFSNFPSSSS